jgi:hypothetical protein
MSPSQAVKFVTSYGTYLDLTDSLIAAANSTSTEPAAHKETIDYLIKMASKHDVRHKHAMQEFSEAVVVVLPVLPAAVLVSSPASSVNFLKSTSGGSGHSNSNNGNRATTAIFGGDQVSTYILRHWISVCVCVCECLRTTSGVDSPHCTIAPPNPNADTMSVHPPHAFCNPYITTKTQNSHCFPPWCKH